MTGFWSERIARDYIHDLRLETGRMLRHGGYKGALVDASDYPIQSQRVAAEHAKAMQRARDMYRVRAAMLTSPLRSKLQMRRMAEETGQRAFDSRDDGLAWLLS